MTGLKVNLNINGAIEASRAAFEEFGPKKFARAIQFNLNRVVIEGVNTFRRTMPAELRHATPFTLKAVRYELDKTALNNVASLDKIVSAAFVMPLQTTWLKYALGEEKRPASDVGIKGYFPNERQIYLPNEAGLRTQGIKPNAKGNYKASDMRLIGRAMARNYSRGDGGRWGVFEIRKGASDPAKLGVGVHARPPAGPGDADQRAHPGQRPDAQADAPKTRFTAAGGRQVTVSRVVNLDTPRLLFPTQPDATYKPVLTPSWEEAFQAAAAKMPKYLEEEIIDKLDHALAKARRR
ncbi:MULTISPECIES: hypothetical protein [unclassified Methylobacterium]|uniref:hypothetical protein n=1 Tax=unclassified Methylobacterium TaxID=2615210 RepID=UPI0011C1E951|nr:MULTISPECIES: hypothetical protein [unclassified Methylobacterium]QEE39834.1 hypothetical protein FVA80_13600 [Methylobacterium sp. WL1]TXN57322.1 hypothetical protein FV241_11710 [Methylobacterium sp. WL2]